MVPAASRAQSLDSLVRLAEQTHPSVLAARTAVEQADARARAALAWEAPSVGVEFNGLPFDNPNPFARGETMLMVEQMIPLFGQNRAMARAEQLGARVGEQELAAAQRDLRARVEREYFTLWLLDRRAALNEESRTLSDALLKSAETQYSVSRAAQSDLLRINIEIERLATERATIDEESREALGRLNALLGRRLDVPVEVSESLTRNVLPTVDSLAALIGNHPALRQMEAMAAMKEAEAEAQLAMLKPMLMLRGGLMYAPEGHVLREGSEMLRELSSGEHGGVGLVPMENPNRFGFSVAAMLRIPLVPWSRSGPEELATVSRLEAQEELYRRDAMQRDMVGMLRSAWSMARRADLRREYYQRTQIPLLERTLQSLRTDYLNGRIPFSSVVEGYSMLIMGRMDAYMQQMEYAMALSELTQLTGGLF
jgi:outer membrane protein TolC